MLDKLTSGDFARYKNQEFRIHDASDSTESLIAELIEVTELGTTNASGKGEATRRPFSIIFRGPADQILPQRTYRVEHEAMGSLDVFLVPIGPDDRGMRYEAVFT
jgi:hypothetical protein